MDEDKTDPTPILSSRHNMAYTIQQGGRKYIESIGELPTEEEMMCDEVVLFWYPMGIHYDHLSVAVRGMEYSFSKRGIEFRVLQPRSPVTFLDKVVVGRGMGSGFGAGEGMGAGSGFGRVRTGGGIGLFTGGCSGLVDGSGVGVGFFEGSGIGLGFGQGHGAGIPAVGDFPEYLGPQSVTNMGKTEAGFWDIFSEVSDMSEKEYGIEKYQLVTHNCRHFADDLVFYLNGKRVLKKSRDSKCLVM